MPCDKLGSRSPSRVAFGNLRGNDGANHSSLCKAARRHSHSLNLNTLIAFATLLFTFTGCGSSDSARIASPTGGTDFTMAVRDETGAEEYFEIDRKGLLGWGGGTAARLTKVTFTTQLTDEELQQFREMLRAADWFRTKPVSTNKPPEFQYRVMINSPESRRTFTIKGDHPDLVPIRALLSEAARRRLKQDLNRLPEPSMKQERQ
jgi:hypothetical protein